MKRGLKKNQKTLKIIPLGGQEEVGRNMNVFEYGNDILIVYWAIDYGGNEEKPHNWFKVDIDQTEPDISISYEVVNDGHGWEFLIWVIAVDSLSGMEKVEFYINRELQDTIYGIGPEYEFLYIYPGKTNETFRVRGFIRDPVIKDDNVSFYAYLVRIVGFPLFHSSFMTCGYDNAGNKGYDQLIGSSFYDTYYSVIYLFRNFTFHNNYEGYIGKFLIFATFNSG